MKKRRPRPLDEKNENFNTLVSTLLVNFVLCKILTQHTWNQISFCACKEKCCTLEKVRVGEIHPAFPRVLLPLATTVITRCLAPLKALGLS